VKTLALLTSLILTIIGVFSLIFLNFFAFNFNYQDLILYFILALAIGLLVWIVGSVLNKKFNHLVTDFINGKEKNLKNKRVFRTYGYVLLVLLPFLIFLLLLALYSAITFTLYAVLLISNAPRIPIAVLIALAIIFFGTIAAVFMGLFRLIFPKKILPYGIIIDQNSQTKLWRLINKTSGDLGTKCIDKIIITPDHGVGVYLEGNFFSKIFGSGRRVLQMGIPSIYDLSINELQAILAHEYGHFNNKDTQWSTFTYAMSTSLIETLKSTPGPGGEGMVGGVMALNPAYWILFFYIKLFFRITNGFSRIREVMADLNSVELYGGEAFKNGLQKIARNDIVFSELVNDKYAIELLDEEKTITSIDIIMKFAYDSIGKLGIKELDHNLLNNSKTSTPYDSHPSLEKRYKLADIYKVNKKDNSDKVNTLFEDWKKIEEDITNLYNYRLLLIFNKLPQEK